VTEVTHSCDSRHIWVTWRAPRRLVGTEAESRTEKSAGKFVTAEHLGIAAETGELEQTAIRPEDGSRAAATAEYEVVPQKSVTSRSTTGQEWRVRGDERRDRGSRCFGRREAR